MKQFLACAALLLVGCLLVVRGVYSDGDKPPVGKGLEACTIEVKIRGNDGTALLPGSHVDIVQVIMKETGARSHIVIEDVRVLAVETVGKDNPTVKLTLEVTGEEARQLKAQAAKGVYMPVLRPGPGNELVKVLVAREDLAQWTPIRRPDEMFEEVEKRKSEVPPNFVPPIAVPETKDRPLIKNMRKGEVLTWEWIQSKDKAGLEALLPAGHRAFSVKVTPDAAAGGFVLPGSHVDIIHVIKKGDEVEARCVLENILVRAVDQLPVRPDDAVQVALQTATFEVTPQQALVLARCAEFGTIRLALRPFGDKKLHFSK